MVRIGTREIFQFHQAKLLERDGLTLGLRHAFHFEAEGDVAERGPPGKQLGKILKDHAAVRAVAFDQCAADTDFARKLQDMLWTKSPTSLAIALRQMQLGASLVFEDAMRVEFRIVSRICRGRDFYEGVRATIVDKDNRPVWRPVAGERPDPAAIDAYFAPLGADELNIRGEAR